MDLVNKCFNENCIETMKKIPDEYIDISVERLKSIEMIGDFFSD